MIGAGSVKTVLAMAGIFLAGSVAGGFVSVAWVRTTSMPQWGTVDQFADRHLGKMIKDLGLTEEQVSRVKPIVKEMAEQLRPVRRRALDDAREIFGNMYSRIEAELTPEQVKLLRTSLEEKRSREAGPPRPPPPDGERHGSPSGDKPPAEPKQSQSPTRDDDCGFESCTSC